MEVVILDKAKLDRYKANVKELDLVAEQINNLNERLENVPEISGKVTGSSKEFPYIEQHVTVRMKEPKESDAIKNKIRKKEKRQALLTQEITEVREFIEALPDGIEKQIMEMVYLEGMNQAEVAEKLDYSKGRISQIISRIAKD